MPLFGVFIMLVSAGCWTPPTHQYNFQRFDAEMYLKYVRLEQECDLKGRGSKATASPLAATAPSFRGSETISGGILTRAARPVHQRCEGTAVSSTCNTTSTKTRALFRFLGTRTQWPCFLSLWALVFYFSFAFLSLV